MDRFFTSNEFVRQKYCQVFTYKDFDIQAAKIAIGKYALKYNPATIKAFVAFFQVIRPFGQSKHLLVSHCPGTHGTCGCCNDPRKQRSGFPAPQGCNSIPA